MRALYAGDVTMTDRWLGRFLDKMDELNLFDNTLLVVLSDHGVALGEHGITGKLPDALWPEVTDIPFFVRHPEGETAGQTSDFFASTHDVAPSLQPGLPRLRLEGCGRPPARLRRLSVTAPAVSGRVRS